MNEDSLQLPRLSIVIVSYNSRGDLDGCLRSLTEPPPRVDHEIVVVDNASADGTREYVREQWPGIRLIDAGGNVGFARGTNIGIRHSVGELVLLLNPDTVVSADAIDHLVATLDRHPEAAVVGPRIVDRHGRAELSFGRMIAPLAELRHKLLVRGHARGTPGVAWLVERMTRTARAPDWVSGACLLVRRADLEAVGLLDERFALYTEDVDLCASLRARGRRILFSPDVEVTHLRGRSAASAPAAADEAYRRSRLAFYEKHHPGWVRALRLYLRVTGRRRSGPTP